MKKIKCVVLSLVCSSLFSNAFSASGGYREKECGGDDNYVSLDFIRSNLLKNPSDNIGVELNRNVLSVTIPQYNMKCLDGKTTYETPAKSTERFASGSAVFTDAVEKFNSYYKIDSLSDEFVEKNRTDKGGDFIDLPDYVNGRKNDKIRHRFHFAQVSGKQSQKSWSIVSYEKITDPGLEKTAPELKFDPIIIGKNHLIRFKMTDGGLNSYYECMKSKQTDNNWSPGRIHYVDLKNSGRVLYGVSKKNDSNSSAQKADIPTSFDLFCYNLYDVDNKALEYKTEGDIAFEKEKAEKMAKTDEYIARCNEGNPESLKSTLEEIKDVPELKQVSDIMQRIIADSVKKDLKDEIKSIKGRGKITLEDEEKLKNLLEDYNRYVQQPIMTKIEELTEYLKNAGNKEDRKRKLDEIKRLKSQLLDDSKILVDEGVVKRLEDGGYFATAEAALTVRETSRYIGGDPKRVGSTYNYNRAKTDLEKLVRNYKAASVVKQKVFLAKAGELTGESEKYLRSATMERNRMPKYQQALAQWQQNALTALQKVCYPTFSTPYTQSNCQKQGEEFKKMYAEQVKMYQQRMAASEERAKKLEYFAGEFKKYENDGKRKVAGSAGGVDDLGMPNDGIDVDEYGLKQFIGTSDEISSSGQFTSQYDPAFANPSQGLQSNYQGFMNMNQQQGQQMPGQQMNGAYPVGQPNYFQQQQNPYAARPMYQYSQPQQPYYNNQYPSYNPQAMMYQQPSFPQQYNAYPQQYRGF